MQTTNRRLSAAVNLPYRPTDPVDMSIPIGLIGCGGIARHHLTAYRDAGYCVTGLCDIDLARAKQRRDEYFPEATVYDDYQDLLRDDSVQVIDVATHTSIRPPILTDALNAGKHVLSQKPFVEDLDVGRRLVDLADQNQVRLAVNQNGRWAPHMSYCRNAVDHSLIGTLITSQLSVHWDHTWVKGTPFESIAHLVLYDYAIHWFDFTATVFANRSWTRVWASTMRTATQPIEGPLLANVGIEFESGLATLSFNAQTSFGRQDRTCLVGTGGTIHCWGPNEKQQQLELHLAEGVWAPELTGCWFSDGFHGTMGELLCSIEQNRQPSISGENNLRILELCFSAVAASATGQSVPAGTIRRLPV